MANYGLELLGWRAVEVDDSVLGDRARESRPSIEQALIGRGDTALSGKEYERALYLACKKIEALEMKLASVFILTTPFVVLIGTAVAVSLAAGKVASLATTTAGSTGGAVLVWAGCTRCNSASISAM